MATDLDRVGKSKGDSQWQSLRHSHDQHRHADDEVLDKRLDVPRRGLCCPRSLLNGKLLDAELDDEDDHGQNGDSCACNKCRLKLPSQQYQTWKVNISNIH